jgi:hypothetical protein
MHYAHVQYIWVRKGHAGTDKRGPYNMLCVGMYANVLSIIYLDLCV